MTVSPYYMQIFNMFDQENEDRRQFDVKIYIVYKMDHLGLTIL